MTKAASGDSKRTLYCSFCGKSQHEVRKLIAGGMGDFHDLVNARRVLCIDWTGMSAGRFWLTARPGSPSE